MRLLLDTHPFVWSVLGVHRLSPAAHLAIEADEAVIFVSVASAWEIAIKVGLGKWPEAGGVLDAFEAHLSDAGFQVLPITVPHGRAVGLMQAPHRDPFDRVLAAQATIEGLTVVTADAKLRSLGAACLW